MPSDTRDSPDAEDATSPQYEAPSLTDSAGELVDGGDLEPEAAPLPPSRLPRGPEDDPPAE
jgi:hypothetical protein